jgi:hypothetical protein
MEALGYEAPFLVEKLLKEDIVETAEEGQALFAEVVRFLILNEIFPDTEWMMISRRVDEAWHQFVLFTVEYTSFCATYFGAYQHHAPSNAPVRPGPKRTREPFSLETFQDQYERLFGNPLPALWYDTSAICLRRRVLLVAPAALRLVVDDDDMVTLMAEDRPLVCVSRLAEGALAFALRARSFYVRELPGDLTDEEKIGLVETLVDQHVLVLAS